MVVEKSGAGDGALRGSGRWHILSLVMDRRAASAAIRCVRLLAHQPELFPRARGNINGHHLGGVRVVPMGIGSGGIQSADQAGTSVAAGLLGAHRIRVRTLLDLAE